MARGARLGPLVSHLEDLDSHLGKVRCAQLGLQVL